MSNILSVDSNRQSGFLAYSGFAAECARAVNDITPDKNANGGVIDNAHSRDQAWSIKFAERLGLYASASGFSITLLCAQELTANALNDISFNPRAMHWEEILSLHNIFQYQNINTTLGLFHRCKHDIDNSDYEVGDAVQSIASRIKKRTIILSGLSLTESVARRTLPFLSDNLSASAELSGDYYVHKSDYRFQEVTYGTTWRSVLYSIRMRFCADYALSNFLSARLTYQGDTYRFSYQEPYSAAAHFATTSRIELAGVYRGQVTSLSLGLVYEQLFDDVARITADSTSVWAVVLRFSPNEFF